MTLTDDQAEAVKKSFLNLLGPLLGQDQVESRYARCLLKWSLQLGLSPDDLAKARVDFSNISFSLPTETRDKVEAIYHLVYMICLDQVVEDVELEVASLYALKLGFPRSIVCDVLNAIVTADIDGVPAGEFREQVLEFLKLNEA